ncbi:MAG: phenylalanine--tRNA ligase beta subunit-related protein [Candidatus Aenigmatarchaeota archaeon]
MFLKLANEVEKEFPNLKALIMKIENVKIQKDNIELEKFKEEVIKEVLEKYDLKSLKDEATFRAYRNFFWKIGIDPTKIRPAAEALVRRILQGNPIPRVNTLVDAYNLASIKTGIAIAAFDLDKLKGDIVMRFAKENEEFLGIGMKDPIKLTGKEIVISDDEKIIAIYPYRDAENTKITFETSKVLFLICGVPDIAEEALINAAKVTIDYVTMFCNGKMVY